MSSASPGNYVAIYFRPFGDWPAPLPPILSPDRGTIGMVEIREAGQPHMVI